MFPPRFLSFLMTLKYVVMFVLVIGRIVYNVMWICCVNGEQSGSCYSVLIRVDACMLDHGYHSVTYSIGGVEIMHVETEKYIGVTIGSTIDSSRQCAKVVSAAIQYNTLY